METIDQMKNIFKEKDCFEQTIAMNMHNPQ